MAESIGTQPRATTPGTNTGDRRDSKLMERVRERATAELQSQKNRARDGLGTVADAARSTTEHLRSQQYETAAEYVEEAAVQIDRLSQRIGETDVLELLKGAGRLAKRHPAAFVGSAFALGLATTRFLRSSEENGFEAEEYGREYPNASMQLDEELVVRASSGADTVDFGGEAISGDAAGVRPSITSDRTAAATRTDAPAGPVAPRHERP